MEISTKNILAGYFDTLEARIAEKKKWQATEHQNNAVETAKELGDTESIGIYLRIFKRYDNYKLIQCKNWVLKKPNCDNRGRLFVATYKKFLGFDKTKKADANIKV